MVRLLRDPPSRPDPPSHSIHLSSHDIPGAGPFEVDVSPNDGATFQPAVVTKDVPGERSRSDAEATDFEMVAQVRTLSLTSRGPSTDEVLVSVVGNGRCQRVYSVLEVRVGTSVSFERGTEPEPA